MLPKRKKHKNKLRDGSDIIRSPGHLQHIRGFTCAVFPVKTFDLMDNCLGTTEAAHVRRGTNAGTGIKPSDEFAIPLCVKHHLEQHAIGEISFEAKYKINMADIARELWNKSPHKKRWEERNG